VKIDRTRRGERPEHAAHDRLLIVRFASGDVTDAEADAARALVATCQDCRLLAADVGAIAGAVADLPAPVRVRDFRITPEQAAGLRRPGVLTRLSRFTGGGDASARLVPLQRLAGAVVAIGLVMAVATSPAGIPGFSSGTATLRTTGAASEGAAPAAAPAAAPGLAVGPNAAALPSSAAAAAPAPASAAPAAAAAPAPASAVPAAAASAAGPAGGPSPAPPAGASPGAAQVAGAGRATATGNPAASVATDAGQPSPFAALAPLPSGQTGVAGEAGSQALRAGTGLQFQPWQAWLLLSVGGLVVFAAIRFARRRPI
jgi:hypothetical protein